MRQTYSSIRLKMIHQYASKILQEVLPWKPFNHSVTVPQVLDMLLLMASLCSSLSDVVKRFFRFSDETGRQAVKQNLPRDEKQLTACLVQLTAEERPSASGDVAPRLPTTVWNRNQLSPKEPSRSEYHQFPSGVPPAAARHRLPTTADLGRAHGTVARSKREPLHAWIGSLTFARMLDWLADDLKAVHQENRAIPLLN